MDKLKITLNQRFPIYIISQAQEKSNKKSTDFSKKYLKSVDLIFYLTSMPPKIAMALIFTVGKELS